LIDELPNIWLYAYTQVLSPLFGILISIPTDCHIVS